MMIKIEAPGDEGAARAVLGDPGQVKAEVRDLAHVEGQGGGGGNAQAVRGKDGAGGNTMARARKRLADAFINQVPDTPLSPDISEEIKSPTR